MFFVILKVAKPRSKIARIDSSNPPNGNEAKKAVPIPRAGSTPIAQAGHPGANMPRKIPVVPKKPNVFPELFLIIIVLYVIMLKSKPRKMLMIIKLTNELKRIVSLNPKKRPETNLTFSKKPLFLKK